MSKWVWLVAFLFLRFTCKCLTFTFSTDLYEPDYKRIVSAFVKEIFEANVTAHDWLDSVTGWDESERLLPLITFSEHDETQVCVLQQAEFKEVRGIFIQVFRTFTWREEWCVFNRKIFNESKTCLWIFLFTNKVVV